MSRKKRIKVVDAPLEESIPVTIVEHEDLGDLCERLSNLAYTDRIRVIREAKRLARAKDKLERMMEIRAELSEMSQPITFEAI